MTPLAIHSPATAFGVARATRKIRPDIGAALFADLANELGLDGAALQEALRSNAYSAEISARSGWS